MAVRFIFLNRAWRLNWRGRGSGGSPVVGMQVPLLGTSGGLRAKAKLSDDLAEKSRPGTTRSTVPQTDTGRQVEDTKVFEITLVKELGNLTP